MVARFSVAQGTRDILVGTLRVVTPRSASRFIPASSESNINKKTRRYFQRKRFSIRNEFPLISTFLHDRRARKVEKKYSHEDTQDWFSLNEYTKVFTDDRFHLDNPNIILLHGLFVPEVRTSLFARKLKAMGYRVFLVNPYLLSSLNKFPEFFMEMIEGLHKQFPHSYHSLTTLSSGNQLADQLVSQYGPETFNSVIDAVVKISPINQFEGLKVENLIWDKYLFRIFKQNVLGKFTFSGDIDSDRMMFEVINSADRLEEVFRNKEVVEKFQPKYDLDGKKASQPHSLMITAEKDPLTSFARSDENLISDPTVIVKGGSHADFQFFRKNLALDFSNRYLITRPHRQQAK